MFLIPFAKFQSDLKDLGAGVSISPRPTKGVVTICPRLHKNAKESDPGHLGHLFYILCSHFDEKKTGGTPQDGVG